VVPVDRALEIVLAHTPSLPAEQVALPDALGRVLADDVATDVDLPPFDRSAMDGYALCAADAVAVPVRLEVVGQLRAGQWWPEPLAPGTAVSIMTGAPVPQGADAVLQIEKARSLDGGRRVELLAEVVTGLNVVRRASEATAGDVVLQRGRTLDPASLAVLAAAGRGRVSVGRRPTVAVVVTGDELVDVWDTPTRGRIRDSNGYAVAAQARWAGADVLSHVVVPDRAEPMAEALAAAFRADVVVVSGGVSEGAFDLVEDVLARLDVGLLFTKVAIRPGAPLVFGRRGEKLVFGLPGNPVSAQVTFDIFVRAALLRMQGARVVQRPIVPVVLEAPLRNRSARRAYLPAQLRHDGTRILARPLGTTGSGDLAAHARANGLVILAADRLAAEAGENADALLLGNFLERDGAS
jgi:molybdopterin molybdotransferase